MYKKTVILLLELFTVSWSVHAYGGVERKPMPDPKEIVRRYSESTSWDKTITMSLSVESDFTSNIGGQESAGHHRLELIFRRDNNRAEWIGNDALLDSAGRVIDKDSFDFATIINDKFYLSAMKHPVLGRFLGHIKRELDRERNLNLLHPDYGGFLEGKEPGVGERLGELKTIAERLTESDDLHIAGTESINDILCYIIEAKTICGKFKVWIAPDKGYNALKYTVNKTGRDLFNGKPIEETKLKEWQLQVDSIKIQKIDDIYVSVEGQHTNRIIYKSGDQVTSTVKVKRSEIDLNPDFEALGAFTFNLPDGTVIHDYDFPGVRYKIFGGELVPHVDKAVIEQTDRMDDEILADVTGKTKPELASSAITVSDLLKKYAETQDKLNSSVIAKFECEEKFVEGNEVFIDRVAPAEARLDGQKYFACTNYEYDKVSDTTLPLDETDYRKFTLWDDERRIKYYDYVEVSRASISRQDKPGAIFASEWPGSPLFGIRYHKAERIDTVLRQCETLSVRDEMQIIDSEACYVIDAKSPTFSYTVWMNPNRGYSISQAVIKFGPGTQGAFGVLSENEDKSLTVSDVRFQQIGEVHVPMVYNAYFERRRDGVVYRKGTVRGKVTDITFDPNHEKLASFVPKMRDGTIITDKDFDLIFRWDDGKLVPDVDEAVIEQTDRMDDEILADVTGETKPELASSAITVSDLLKKYAETQDKLQSFITKSEETMVHTSERTGITIWKTVAEFRVDGDRVDYRSYRWHNLASEDEATNNLEEAQYRSFVWDGSRHIEYRTGETVDDNSAFIHRQTGPYQKRRAVAIEYGGAPLLGIFYRDEDRVDSVLRKADSVSVRDELEHVGGVPCYVIDAKTKWGTYTVWIDPEHGYNIAKADVQRKKGDLIWRNRTMTDKSGSFSLKNVRFEKIDDAWVPMEGDIGTIMEGPTYIQDIKVKHQRTEVILNPDHDMLGSFIPDIENGTDVYIEGAPGITYTWQDGKVVDKQGRVIADFSKKAGKAQKENNSDAKTLS